MVKTGINKKLLNEKRAEYRKQIVNALSAQLTQEYGRAGAENNYCIVSALRRKLLDLKGINNNGKK